MYCLIYKFYLCILVTYHSYRSLTWCGSCCYSGSNHVWSVICGLGSPDINVNRHCAAYFCVASITVQKKLSWHTKKRKHEELHHGLLDVAFWKNYKTIYSLFAKVQKLMSHISFYQFLSTLRMASWCHEGSGVAMVLKYVILFNIKIASCSYATSCKFILT